MPTQQLSRPSIIKDITMAIRVLRHDPECTVPRWIIMSAIQRRQMLNHSKQRLNSEIRRHCQIRAAIRSRESRRMDAMRLKRRRRQLTAALRKQNRNSTPRDRNQQMPMKKRREMSRKPSRKKLNHKQDLNMSTRHIRLRMRTRYLNIEMNFTRTASDISSRWRLTSMHI